LAVAECLHALGGEGWTFEGIVAQRDNSRIHRVRRGSRTAAVKECLDRTSRAPDSEAASREYDALTAVADKSAARGDRSLAPRPLTLCRERAAYAMTWASGRTATEIVLAHSTPMDRAEELGEIAGGWLRRFHACMELSVRTNDFATRLDFISELARTIRDRDHSLTRAARVLIERASDAANVLMPASWIHGDMKSDNLLVDADGVTGLDVQLADENTVAYDLAPFLNHLRLLRWSPRGLLRRPHLEAMSDGFLRAYSPNSGEWQLPLMWLRSYLLFQMVANSAAGMSLRALAAKWPARKELASAIDWLDA